MADNGYLGTGAPDFSSFFSNNISPSSKYQFFNQWNGGNGPGGDGQNAFPFNPYGALPEGAEDQFGSYAQANPGNIRFTGPGGNQLIQSATQEGPMGSGSIVGPGGFYYGDQNAANQVAAQSNKGGFVENFLSGPGPLMLMAGGLGYGALGGGFGGASMFDLAGGAAGAFDMAGMGPELGGAFGAGSGGGGLGVGAGVTSSTGGGMGGGAFDMGGMGPGLSDQFGVGGAGMGPTDYLKRLMQMKSQYSPYGDIASSLYGMMRGNQMRDLSKPGTAAAGQLTNLTNNPGAITSTPGYQELLNQRIEAARRAKASAGLNLSGSEMSSLANLGGQQYMDYRNTEMNRLSGQVQQGMAPMSQANSMDSNSINRLLYGLARM